MKNIGGLLGILSFTLALAGCFGGDKAPGGPDVSALNPAQTSSGFANQITGDLEGRTFVAYEVAKDNRTLVPSFCAAPEGLVYGFPQSVATHAVCGYTTQFRDGRERQVVDGELKGFNPPGAQGSKTTGAKLRLRSNDPSSGDIMVFEVPAGKYFPAFYAFSGNIASVSGRTPYYDVKPGTITYLGSYAQDITGQMMWRPDIFLTILDGQGRGDLKQRASTDVPTLGRVQCDVQNTGFNVLGSNVGGKSFELCSLHLTDKPFVKTDTAS